MHSDAFILMNLISLYRLASLTTNSRSAREMIDFLITENNYNDSFYPTKIYGDLSHER